jgi:hypothetical protein
MPSETVRWDAVEKMFYNVSDDTLNQFLKFSKEKFKLVQSAYDKTNKTMLVIYKRDHEVLVSHALHTLTVALRH